MHAFWFALEMNDKMSLWYDHYLLLGLGRGSENDREASNSNELGTRAQNGKKLYNAKNCSRRKPMEAGYWNFWISTLQLLKCHSSYLETEHFFLFPASGQKPWRLTSYGHCVYVQSIHVGSSCWRQIPIVQRYHKLQLSGFQVIVIVSTNVHHP